MYCKYCKYCKGPPPPVGRPILIPNALGPDPPGPSRKAAEPLKPTQDTARP